MWRTSLQVGGGAHLLADWPASAGSCCSSLAPWLLLCKLRAHGSPHAIRPPLHAAAGRADIATGQLVLENKLDTLLQRQQAVLDAANQASATLTAIKGLSERQVAALNGLDAAVKEQVRTISVATQQGLISLATVRARARNGMVWRHAGSTVLCLSKSPCARHFVCRNKCRPGSTALCAPTCKLLLLRAVGAHHPTPPSPPNQALSYWKVARRNRATEKKIYRLANTPCTGSTVLDNSFTVDNGNDPANGTARDRSVGLNNRIIGGLLLHTWRTSRGQCPATRFSAIQVSGLSSVAAPEEMTKRHASNWCHVRALEACSVKGRCTPAQSYSSAPAVCVPLARRARPRLLRY